MTTGSQFEEFYAGKIWNLQAIRDRFIDSLREEVRLNAVDLWGAGGPLASVSATYTQIDTDTGTWTLDADFEARTEAGYRVEASASDPVWNDVPIDHSASPTRVIGALFAQRPVGAELGYDNQPRWSAFEEAIGRELTVTSVTINGAGLDIVVDLPTGEDWRDAARVRQCVVWYTDSSGNPAVATTEALFEGTITNSSLVYTVAVPHQFGQASASTTPARYTVLMLGPSVTKDLGLSGWTNYAVLGEVDDVTWVPATAILTSFGAHVLTLTSHIADSSDPHGATLTQTNLEVGTLAKVGTEFRVGDGSSYGPTVFRVKNQGGSEAMEIAPASLPGSIAAVFTGGMDIDATLRDWRLLGGTMEVEAAAAVNAVSGADFTLSGATIDITAPLVTMNAVGGPLTQTAYLGPGQIVAHAVLNGPVTVDIATASPMLGELNNGDLGDYAYGTIDLDIPAGVDIAQIAWSGTISATSAQVTLEILEYDPATGIASSIFSDTATGLGAFTIANSPPAQSGVHVTQKGKVYAARFVLVSGGGGAAQIEFGAIRVGYYRTHLFI